MGNVDPQIVKKRLNRLTFPIFKVGNLDLGNVYRTPILLTLSVLVHAESYSRVTIYLDYVRLSCG